METTNAIRRKILDAALQRFCHYGYPKTTMAELAADCCMSPGNLYRYFTGKLDIAAAIVREQSLFAVEQLRPVLDCPERNARQRLIDCLFADLRNTFHLLEHRPRLVEMAQLVAQSRPDLQAETLRREREILTHILRIGAEAGEFRLTDADRTAQCLQSLLTKFRFPQLFTRQSLVELEQELSDILAVVLAGLSQKSNAAQPSATAMAALPAVQLRRLVQMGTLKTHSKPAPAPLHISGG